MRREVPKKNQKNINYCIPVDLNDETIGKMRLHERSSYSVATI